jgi:hypothetical protein
MFTTNPRLKVNYDESKAQTNDPGLLQVIEKQQEYDNFCKSQTKTGQTRKNKRRKTRRQIFKDVPDSLIEKVRQINKEIEKQKIRDLPFVDVVIHYDGRKKGNFSKFVQAVELDLNVGGISPQYYGLGFKGYKIK